ncbi:glutamyl-tRNA(Gln) amidotransferase subunit B, mitochondrial [Anthonomus grandis grandis]|uniref:glutamyl-tRNA(Gln) amidotransferase subunit B, mitochondrial n=1 Tax=Anthonomus grandis grandis TaxID=2921223 RepID=UPI002165ECDB|nr:glutamyl-tRNA(Gln) amidotransferase subunit B, mitochondrial [Anthonomus grandis grandis]
MILNKKCQSFWPKVAFLKKHYSHSSKNSTKWKSVVGLEVHAQIQTNSKLFSGAPTTFSSPVNNNVSLFDMATPGTLPVLNKKCVEAGVLTALSLNCTVNPVSYFDRKHYFYADLPSGYQITQQRAPLASNGCLEFQVFSPGIHKVPYKAKVNIKQLQLEQDSGKSLHDFDRSLVDLNRAGIPLMELVFEPDLVDGEEAAALIKELMIILQRIKTCSCKMEEGALRVDANVSIHKKGEPLGTRTEIKNIGSVRGVAGAIKYEIERQINIKNNNGTISNETRAWNPEKKITVPMRDKEVQQDYRYMPEPNLPPLHIGMGPVKGGTINADEIKSQVPELPEETRVRLVKEFGLTSQQSIILVNDFHLQKLFEETITGRTFNPSKFANFLIYELYQCLNDKSMGVQDITFDLHYIADVMDMIENATINRTTAVLVLEELLQGNLKQPLKIVEDNNWRQISDESDLREICQQVMQENEKAVKDYLSGKEKVFKFLMKAVANKAGGKADMKKCVQIFKTLLLERLKK